MQLIGSVTSPFVRRIRLFLHGVDYDFLALDIFSPEGREVLSDNNPAKKIPVLKDDGLSIYDSRIIFNYLNEKLGRPALSWPQQNLLTVIDAANDSLVALFLSRKSELPVDQDVMFYNLQKERIEAVFKSLDESVAVGEFDTWHYPAICLFCLLDWVDFREVAPWRHHQNLVNFLEKAKSKNGVAETDPR